MMKSSHQQAIETVVAAIQEDDRPLAAAMASPEVTLSSASAVESSQPDLLVQDQTAVDLANSVPSIIKKQSTAVMKPDIGILRKDFLKNKGREQQPDDKQFAIHRKKRAAAVDVDVGILDEQRRSGRQWQQKQAFDTNLRAKNDTGRSTHPYMCPYEFDYALRPGVRYFDRLFNKTNEYFPRCSCPSPTTCGPQLCECLELDADGDILQCMDPLKQLCEGTKYIDGIPGPWSMEECLGSRWNSKGRALAYCSFLPCLVDGDSYWQCKCEYYDSRCTEYRDAQSCARSKCCHAQSDDEGRQACFIEGYKNYFDQVTSFSIPEEEMISRFNECSFDSENNKSIVECYCDSFSYGLCVNYGVEFPDTCEANICCDGQTEDDARLDCFSRFRNYWTGSHFHSARDTMQESCVASGRSSARCNCDIFGLSDCVGHGFVASPFNFEPNCYLLQCCQSQTDDEGRKDCVLQHETQLMYESCLNFAGEWWGSTEESCVCDKSNTLCSSGHLNNLHCELSICCQEQANDTGRKECIENFTTSQPSSAPSETTPAEDSRDEAEASPEAASALPVTSSASIPTPLSVKSHAKTTSKMLAVTAAVISWLLFT